MSKYVVCLPDIDNGDVLLVLKDRPPWQAGRLNLVGGKIEDGEHPREAALRELKEEAGIDGEDAIISGVIQGKEVSVYCCRIKNIGSPEINPRPEETEKVDWYKWDDVKDDPRLMPNLKVIIPLLRMGVDNWKLIDIWSEEEHETHRVELILKK
jgi:8-oxo-dGTP pyrophosphatase MutT (NUDIX family)